MTEGKSRKKTYSDQEIEVRLKADLPRWRLKDGFICRTYKTHGWKSTLMLINAVGHLAEAAWHHPDLAVSYASVEVRLKNHDAGGITDKDFELAKKIDDIIEWQPGKEGGSLSGTPQDPRYAYIKYES